MNDSERIGKLEAKIATIEQKLNRSDFGLSDPPPEEQLLGRSKRRRKTSGDFLGGVILVGIGLFWLSNSVGWFHFDLPIGPTIIIILGLLTLIKSLGR